MTVGMWAVYFYLKYMITLFLTSFINILMFVYSLQCFNELNPFIEYLYLFSVIRRPLALQTGNLQYYVLKAKHLIIGSQKCNTFMNIIVSLVITILQPMSGIISLDRIIRGLVTYLRTKKFGHSIGQLCPSSSRQCTIRKQIARWQSVSISSV